MANEYWPTRLIDITNLHLDTKNSRLGRETLSRAPREIIQYLFDNDKAAEVAESIAYRGFFANEPLLAVNEGGKFVVIEGNRRLAALKALREPGLLEGSWGRKMERIVRLFPAVQTITKVPVTIAPNRRATDRQIVGRHIGTPVLAWKAENRASFILDKIEEGYDNERLSNQLGFTTADIQNARETRAIADMARSLDLRDEIKAKLASPRAKIYTTLKRVFDSTVGREYLKVEPDPEHGIRGTTSKAEFVRAFTKLVTEVAAGKPSSRDLNKNEDIRAYFGKWAPAELPQGKGTFIPAEIIQGKSVASQAGAKAVSKRPKAKQLIKTVLPKDFRVRIGNDRLVDIRDELVKLKPKDFPNASAVLLRVFFELSVVDYLERTGELAKIASRIEGAGGKLPYGKPIFKQLIPEIRSIARKHLSAAEADRIEKATRYDPAAPFTISDLHGFVHSSDLPSERDILQFWTRTEPLFRLILEQEPTDPMQ
jgi:hypothetical protein